MLLKIEMKFADNKGNPVRKCSIVKCHKRHGDAVDYGDSLFDIRVEEVLEPSAKAAARAQANSLNEHPGETADFASQQLKEKRLAHRPEMSNGNMSVHLVSYRRVIATDKAIMCRICSEEGSQAEIGDVLALLTASEQELVDVNGGVPIDALPFRVVTSPLEFDAVLDRISERFEIARASGRREYHGKNFITFWSEDGEGNRTGIYLNGGCHVALLFPCKQVIQRFLKGRCCMMHYGMVAESHSELLLQAFRGDLPQDCTEEVISKLHLSPDYFRPRLFEPTFVVPGPGGPEEYPKNVVIIDGGPDVARTLYRHRRYGFLVDPGGGWLNGLDWALNDLSVVTWFRREFVSIGQISAEKHVENLTRIVALLKKNTGAHILILNNMTVEPNSSVHNYQFIKNPQMIRRLEFHVALLELSRTADVFILDVDRITKRVGIRTGQDWNHYHPTVNLLLAERAARIMHSVGVF
jgi:hypothetical protein